MHGQVKKLPPKKGIFFTDTLLHDNNTVIILQKYSNLNPSYKTSATYRFSRPIAYKMLTRMLIIQSYISVETTLFKCWQADSSILQLIQAC